MRKRVRIFGKLFVQLFFQKAGKIVRLQNFYVTAYNESGKDGVALFLDRGRRGGIVRGRVGKIGGIDQIFGHGLVFRRYEKRRIVKRRKAADDHGGDDDPYSLEGNAEQIGKVEFTVFHLVMYPFRIDCRKKAVCNCISYILA